MALLTNINGKFSVSDAGAVTFNNAFTFPTADGTANYVLKTNGSGQLAWAADSIGMEDWIIAGDTGTTTITDGDTMTIAGGTNVTTVESGGTVTINSTDQYVGTVTGTGAANRVAYWTTANNISYNDDFKYTGANKIALGGDLETTLADFSTIELGNTGMIMSEKADSQYNALFLSNNAYYTDAWRYKTASVVGANYISLYQGKILFATAPAPTTAGDAITWSTKMTLLNNGNVGIGTVSPDAILNISKTSFSTTFTSADSYIRIGKGENATNGYQFIGFGYNNGSADLVPAYIGYQQTGAPGNYTKGDLVFGTRNVTTNTAPTERMRITSDGMVGIGMTPSTVGSSTYVLQLYNPGSQCFLSLGNGTSGNGPLNGLVIGNDVSNAYIVNREATSLIFATSDANRMTILAGGNVGINTTNPDNKLTVKDANCIIDAQSTADSQTIGFRAGYLNNADLCGFFRYTTADAQLYIDNNFTGNNGLYSDINFRNKAFNGTSLVHRVKIKGSTGNVGIGTESPRAVGSGYKGLEISSSSSGSSLWLSGFSDSTKGYLAMDTGGLNLTAISNHSLTFGTNNSPKMTILSGGDVGIGITSPNAKLAVNGNLRVEGNSSGTSVSFGGSGDFQIDAPGVGGGRFIVKHSTGDVGIGDATPSYKLDVAGTIRATGDVIAYSDVRVKENIKTIDNSLEKVSKLRGVEFNKIGNNEKSIGVIAQEIEKVIPEVVKEDDKGMKSVAYGNISGLLIEAIKELKAEVEELKLNNCNCNK
jgi:uncharacterized protein YaiE (UPF0345 family)